MWTHVSYSLWRSFFLLSPCCQNRFEIAAKGIAISAENLQAAESRIRDSDMASEMVEYTKNKILTQSGTAMLVQANSQSQNVLRLLS